MPGVTVDEDLLRGLLAGQFPDLAGLPVRKVARGWDNELWRLGEDLALRIPMLPHAPELLRKEYQWVPALAAGLPLPVPVPLRLGEPTSRFPFHWTVARWVPGDPADRAPVTRGEHAAGALGAFLRALHSPAPGGAPVNPSRSIAVTAAAGHTEALIGQFAPPEIADGVRQVWAAAVAAPAWDREPAWIHADLHPANVVTAAGTLAGVIDFGEVCAGDPATDLAAAWLLLPLGAARRCLAAYGAVDGATIARARGWAARIGLMLAQVGRNGDLGLPGGKPTWGPAGRLALQRVVADG